MASAKQVLTDEFHLVVDELFKCQIEGEFSTEILCKESAEDRIHNVLHGPGDMVSSSIGMESDGVQCSLAVLGRSDTIKATCRYSTPCAQDWIGEFANRLMGALKNNLCEYHVPFTLGLPVSVRGINLEFLPTDLDHQTVAVTLEQGMILVVLYYEFEFDMQWQRDPGQATAEEGEVCLF